MTHPEQALVLVVEDEPAPREMLQRTLQARGFRVQTSPTARRALELADAQEPDVVIVDLGLPDMDGLALCRHLRTRTSTPIIVLTADVSEERMILALDEGADDYVKKPFSMPELLARVRVAVRRRTALAAIVPEEIVEIGALRIDTAGFVVTVAGRLVQIPPKQFQLLTILARNAGRLVNRRALIQQIWGPNEEESRANALRLLVSGLRQSLGDAPGVPAIVSEVGVGYRLLAAEG